MATAYLDEDLSTGDQDGTSWANAYRTWALMVTGEATTLTEDLDIYVRSTGTASVQRDLLASDGWVTDGNVLSIIGDVANIPELYFSNTFGVVLETDLDDIIVENLNTRGGGRGFQTIGSLNTLINCNFIDANTEGVYKAGDTGAGGAVSLYNCNSVGTAEGFRVQAFRYMNLYNCYSGGNSGTDYLEDTNGVMTLTTCASEDATGSAGLQTIAYSTSTFTNVTAGTEDFHLVSGSSLIAAGTATSFATDQAGDSWGSPYDIGVFVFVSAGGNAPTADLQGSLIGPLGGPIMSIFF